MITLRMVDVWMTYGTHCRLIPTLAYSCRARIAREVVEVGVEVEAVVACPRSTCSAVHKPRSDVHDCSLQLLEVARLAEAVGVEEA
jgi:hypothetical protein